MYAVSEFEVNYPTHIISRIGSPPPGNRMEFLAKMRADGRAKTPEPPLDTPRTVPSAVANLAPCHQGISAILDGDGEQCGGR
jgi:hypothetical protein